MMLKASSTFVESVPLLKPGALTVTPGFFILCVMKSYAVGGFNGSRFLQPERKGP
jgi:hypothetical protein